MEKLFPILIYYPPRGPRPDLPRGIPWEIVAPHEAQAIKNHDQSLKVLASRGGLGWSEILAVLEDRDWRHIPELVAYEAVMKIVREYQAAKNPPPPSPQSPSP